MNWLDLVIVLVIAWLTYSAFGAGLIREIVGLIAAVLAVVVAGVYYDALARDVLTFIEDDTTALVVAFLMLLGSVYFLGQLLAYILKQTVSLLMLGWADHLAGAAFGFLKGFVLVEILLILFVTYPELGLDDVIAGSAFAQVFLEGLPVLLALLPDEFEAAVDSFPF